MNHGMILFRKKKYKSSIIINCWDSPNRQEEEPEPRKFIPANYNTFMT